MRKIIVISMITLDGVMQAPGGPEEDPQDNFKYGGWLAPYNNDDVYGKAMQQNMEPTDILLGRKTFDIFESYWPAHAYGWPGINDVTKYVLSASRKTSGWKNSVFLENLEDIKKLKHSEGGDIQVWGSAQLVQLLLQHDLVDELRIITHPLTLGKGKKLFGDTAVAAAFIVTQSTVAPNGVILVNYKRAGEVTTGTVEA